MIVLAILFSLVWLIYASDANHRQTSLTPAYISGFALAMFWGSIL